LDAGKVNQFRRLRATSAGAIRVYHQQPSVRLVGFSAPETRHAECSAEFGAILIEEGLAVPFVCGATHCPKTPRPWCH